MQTINDGSYAPLSRPLFIYVNNAKAAESDAYCDEIKGTLADAGVPVTVPISQIREGVRIGIVEDPDGYRIEFIQGR